LGNVDNAAVALELDEIQATARKLGLEVARFEIRRAGDIAPAFEALKSWADALYVSADSLVFTNGVRINTLAVGARLPTMYIGKEYVAAEGLMSYGPNYSDLPHTMLTKFCVVPSQPIFQSSSPQSSISSSI
jgi:putative ABC transport system substrate-binding protein